MSAHQALKKLRKSMTLDEVRAALLKKGVKTSVATLWRILDSADHETSSKLADAIRNLKPAKA